MALPARVVAESARAGIERCDQHKVGGKVGGSHRAADRDRAIFERLAQHFEGGAVELGQFVEEEDAIMGEADLAGRGRRAAADEAGVADRVVRRAEGATNHQRPSRREHAHRAVDATRFD